MPNSIDKRFKISITSNRLKEPIESWLPEDIEFEVNSDWDTPFAAGFSRLNNILSVFNTSTLAQWNTISLWQGNSPIQITIPMQFIAENEGEAKTKVIDRVRDLVKLTLPSLSEGEGIGSRVSNFLGILTPPGPNPVGNALKGVSFGPGGEDINVNIGNFLRFSRVIVLRVNPVFSTLLDSKGYPMRASASVTFRTFNTPVKNDMAQILTSSGSNVGKKVTR